MAETQRKLLEVILNALRPGTPENKVLKSITGQSGDDIPVTDPTNPSSLGGSGTLTRYSDDPDNISLRQDNLLRFDEGPGPDPYLGLESDEIMNVAPRNYNQFQKALLESKGKLYDPTDKSSVFDPVHGSSARLAGDDMKLDDLMENVAGKAERKVKRQETQELDLEGKRFDEGVDRVEKILVDEVTLDPLFPNPQHPRSATRQAIKGEARNTEINAEVQDVISRFKKRSEEQGLFDIEKLKKAPLNPTSAVKKAAAAGDRKAIAEVEKIKLNSRLWDGWKKLSNAAAKAREGNKEALAVVRNFDNWLHKTARNPDPANLEGPMREVPANPTMTMIGKDLHTEHLAGKKPTTTSDQFGNRGRSDVDELGPKVSPNPENLKRRSSGKIETSPSTVVPGTDYSIMEYPTVHQDAQSVLLDALKQTLKDGK
tara:strand:- start:4671 stop:5954 length:1284 start_codon:yes stop_codon:yes gene_type:complete